MERHEEKEKREFIRFGTVAAAIYNVNRDPKRHPQAFTAADIFPGIAGPAPAEREATVAELDMFFHAVAAQYKKTGKNGKRGRGDKQKSPRVSP